MLSAKIFINDIENYGKNYDRSKIYTINGETIRIYDGCGMHRKHCDAKTMDVKLENGDTRSLIIAKESKYKTGDTVIVYTNGKSYAASEKGLINNESAMYIYYILIAIFTIVPFLTCLRLLNIRGFLLLIILSSFILCI